MAVKLEANVGQYVRAMKEAEASVKSLTSASKLAESEFKLTGNAEDYQAKKGEALTRQIEAQRRAVQAAQRGLEQMSRAFGANSAQAQEWQMRLNNAQTKLNNLQASFNSVKAGTDSLQRGMKGAGQETKSMVQIANSAKFTAFNTALRGVESAVSRTVSRIKSLGQTIWNTGKDSASWADSLATNASKYGIDTRTLQQWEYAARFIDVEASTIASSTNKLFANMRSSSAETADAFRQLGVNTRAAGGQLRSQNDVYWETIDSLSRMTDETTKDALAQQLFGKSFAELRPLIDAGRDSWEAYCEQAERAGYVLDDEQVGKLTRFNDSLDRMGASWQALKNTFMAELAPGFQEISDTLTEVTDGLIEWARSAEGQDTLNKFTDAIKAFLQSLTGENVGNTIDSITDGISHLGDAAKTAGEHATQLINTLKSVGIGAGVLWGGGQLLKWASGIKALLPAAGTGAAATGGTAAAATGGTAAATGGTAAAATGGTTAAATGGTAAATGGTAAAGGGFGAAIAPVATGAAGFTLGIAAVLGVGLLAKGLAGPETLANFGGSLARRPYEERNRQRQEMLDERHQKGFQDMAKGSAADVVEAIEALKEGTDWRTEEARRTLTGLTGEDITKAIDAANLHWDQAEQAGEGAKPHLQVEIELTGEAVTAALADGEITQHEIEAVQKYVNEHFTPAVDEAVSMIKGGWQTVLDQMNKPEGTGTPTAPKTEREVLTYTAMSMWVRKTMGKDEAQAKIEAQALWISLIQAAGSPEKMNVDLQQSAEAAKASGTNDTWEAMVLWVKNTLGADEETAEGIVTELWNQLGTFARDKRPELDNTYNPTGEQSTVFQDYVQGVYGGDYEAAKATLDGWLDDLDKAVEQHQPKAGDGSAAGTDGSSYLTGKVAQLVEVKTEIETILTAVQEALKDGVTVDGETLRRLEELMHQAEQLSSEIGWYEQAEQKAGRGAMGLAMQGIDLERTLPLAMKYISDVRKHELEGIEADLAAKETAAGDAFVNYTQAYDTVAGLERAGKTGTDEYAKAVNELEKAKKAHETAQKEYEDAKDTADERRQAVENEYAENLAEIEEGSAKALGYNGQGKATVGKRFEVDTQGIYEHNTPGYIASLSNTAMGGARAWGNPFGANTEAGKRLMRNQSLMDPLQRQMADALAAQFGTYEAFLAGMDPAQRQAMEGILNYTSGSAAESDYWSNVMFSAFGKGPASTYMNGGGGSLSDAQATEAWQFLAALTGFTPRETQSQANLRSLEEAQKFADEQNALLQQLADQTNESSGYNAFREHVQSLVDTGAFEGVDWSQIDGGALEDVLADMAAEAQAAGEEIPTAYGTGMESSRDTVINAGESLDAGLQEGIEGNAGLVVGAAVKMAQAIVAAIRGELDIHSPSKVMEGLGGFVGEGFAMGISDSVGSVQGAMAAMTGATMRPVMAMAGAAAGNSYSGSSAIYIDNYHQNSAEDINYLRDALADMQQRELQGFGLRR